MGGKSALSPRFLNRGCNLWRQKICSGLHEVFFTWLQIQDGDPLPLLANFHTLALVNIEKKDFCFKRDLAQESVTSKESFGCKFLYDP